MKEAGGKGERVEGRKENRKERGREWWIEIDEGMKG